MNKNIDALSVMEQAACALRIDARYEQGKEMEIARAAVAELIEADEEFDAAGDSLEFIQNSTSPRVGSYAMLNAAIERYEYSRIRRSSALARIRGEQ